MLRSLVTVCFASLLLSLPLNTLAAPDRPQDAVAGAQIGKLAPDFTLTDVKGKKFKLSELRGKVVLINFWATWCPPCRAEMPSMEKLNTLLAGEDFILLAINVEEDGKTIVQDFLKEEPHNFPVLLDLRAEVQEAYGVFRFPETFIVRRDGIIAEHVIGAIDWTDRKVINFIKFLIQG